MWEKFKRFRWGQWSFLASGLFVLGGWLWASLALKDIREPLIIHFTGREGIDEIGGLRDLFFIGALGAVMVLLNFLLARTLETRDLFLEKIVAAFTFLLGLLIFITFAAIINVN